MPLPPEMIHIEKPQDKNRGYGAMDDNQETKSTPAPAVKTEYQPLGSAAFLAAYVFYSNLPKLSLFFRGQQVDLMSGLNEIKDRENQYTVLAQLANILLIRNPNNIAKSIEEETLFLSVLNQALDVDKAEYVKKDEESNFVKTDMLFILNKALTMFSLDSKGRLMDYKSRVENNSIAKELQQESKRTSFSSHS